MTFLWSALSGWAAALLLAAGIGAPYLARTARPPRLWPHYCMGLMLPPAATMHAWVPMSSMPIRRLDMTGLLLATAALAAMIWQAGLGLTLRSAHEPQRSRLKRLHLGTMTILVALVIGHIALNRA